MVGGSTYYHSNLDYAVIQTNIAVNVHYTDRRADNLAKSNCWACTPGLLKPAHQDNQNDFPQTIPHWEL